MLRSKDPAAESALRTSLVVVDDFHPDPDLLAARARASGYFLRGSTAYLRSTDIALDAGSVERIAQAIGSPGLTPAPRYTSGGFRISLPSMQKTNDIHVDFGADWNIILFLSRDDRPDCGTSLWRHRATGLYAMPSLEELPAHGFRDEEDFAVRVLDDGLDRSRWVETERVAMRFNRLVAIRSRLFHSMTADFGTSAADARLIQVFFLNDGPAAGEAAP